MMNPDPSSNHVELGKELIEGLSKEINQIPSELFHTQKQVEVEWKKTVLALEVFSQQTNQWLSLFDKLMNSFKDLGSSSSIIESVEREMHCIAYTLQQQQAKKK